MTNNGGATTFTFTGNGTFTFEFIDSYGNTGSEIATVNWIDKTAPICNITYSPNSITNGNVIATLSCNETGIIIVNNYGSNNYIFNNNGSFTFILKDSVGNIGTKTATVNWIMKPLV